MFKELSDNEEKFKNIKVADLTPALRTELLASVGAEKALALAAVLVKNGTALCPTIIQYRIAMLGDDASVIKDERLQYVDSLDRKSWAEFAARFSPGNRSLRELRYQKGLDVIRMMHQGGVQLLAGTDLGNPFLYAGYSLHDELSLFVQAGLSPLAALQTATINPAKYAGKEKEIGTVTQGKIADLILLDDNPLTNILNTKKINAVILNGKLLKRKDLDKLLQQAKENIKLL
jgi:imidazolonepropionase-like amidohydrolase